MTDWRATGPSRRLEAHFGDRLVPCFAERPGNVHALLADAAARRPDGEALVCGETRLIWTEVLERSAAVAAGLRQLGVSAGDRIALLLGNKIEFVLAWFGAARLGAVTVPLGIRQQRPEIAYALKDCSARVLIHEAELADRVPSPTEAPALERRIAVGLRGPDTFEALVGGASGDPPVPVPVGEEDTAAILYTSGTTGRPKGAMLTNLGIVHSAMVFESCMELTADDRSVAAVPLSHVTGLIANIAALARCAGALVILPAFKAGEFLAVAEHERMSHTVIVPAMYNLCLLEHEFEARDLSAWRIGGYGGAPMPTATIERLAEKLPRLKLMNAYGATETTSPAVLMPPRYTATHSDSVGKAVPCATLAVMDEQGRELPRGEVGEIWIHGPAVVRGYWNNLEATEREIVAGFWRSGDLGSIDAEGFVRVLDRKKDMINRAGYKVYSVEVETVLAAHPGVVECAVVGTPCAILGERCTLSWSHGTRPSHPRSFAPSAPSACPTTRPPRASPCSPTLSRATPMARF